MVCLQEERMTVARVLDQTSAATNAPTTFLQLSPSKTIESVFREVCKDFGHNIEEIELLLQSKNGSKFKLTQFRQQTMEEAGIQCSLLDSATITITQRSKNSSIYLQELTEDDLLLGASASPTAGDAPAVAPDLPLAIVGEFGPGTSHAVHDSSNYVGLVNQAMTCYLNSLLQALYMTPEFRNALYNWEFDGVNETRSIPYQLQKLFLNLQTSSKAAVETTDLTTSFGWQGSDAWHQHDIQELCRVMFDALEQKFKDTKQANLINDLYEGKMLDYVKCLECGTEKSREDTFLDIPLPVRPFGSAVAYNSVEEALRAFVQPETLDGNNQYNCEKCNKKCDAHKGLKFTKFPYLLTLHLKRFDFDYNTMHRIKLNDKVVFPEILNLNSFVPVSRGESEPMEEKETIVKCDDCSTTDSGSADDESCQGTDVSSTVNGQDDNCADSDEGIDIRSGNNQNEAKEPYVYELFSIMIHSGSASGGHYYAYIKDFDRDQWFCFNDQSVTTITDEDIKKTYGGGPQRGYYSGAYSSSTNAYMLMYRQIDKDRNCRAITVDNFPPHIQKLLENMRHKEEEDRINKEKENETVKITVFCRKPSTGILEDTKIAVLTSSTLAEAAQYAHLRFKLAGEVDEEDCRLVLFNPRHESIYANPESDQLKISEVSNVELYLSDWFLEIRKKGEPWKDYQAGGINMKVYPLDMKNEDIEEPSLVRVDIDMTVLELKLRIGEELNIPDEDVPSLKIVMEMYNKAKLMEKDDEIVKFDPICTEYKLYAAITNDYLKLKRLVDQFKDLICLTVSFPKIDKATCEGLSIPSLDLNQNLDKLELSGGDRGTNSPSFRVSPQPCDGFGDQSNSEDSSLSDGDRTLVGDAPGENMGLLSSSSNSPADQHMASPTDPREDNYDYDVLVNPSEEMHWDDEETQQEAPKAVEYFYKVVRRIDTTSWEAWPLCGQFIVLVDQRMTLEQFKKNLEKDLRVPSEYFKIFRRIHHSDDEWSNLSDTLRSARNGERFILKLGRVLRSNEYNCKVYHLKPDCLDANIFLFDYIVTQGQTVSSAKKEILLQAKKEHMLDIPYNKCRLREKNWRKPRKIYFEDQRFPDKSMITSLSNFGVYLQELKEVDTVTSSNQLVLFMRRWHPSSLTLGPFHEVVLESTEMDELKAKISEVSGIPAEHVEVAPLTVNFPCDMHALDVHTELQWNLQAKNLEQLPIHADEGSTFFYRDGREALKELTPEERKELSQKENVRLGRLSIKSYSPGRERALKIYLDTSPAKSEDCVD